MTSQCALIHRTVSVVIDCLHFASRVESDSAKHNIKAEESSLADITEEPKVHLHMPYNYCTIVYVCYSSLLTVS